MLETSFSTMFSKGLFFRVIKVGVVCKGLKLLELLFCFHDGVVSVTEKTLIFIVLLDEKEK